MNGKGDIVRPTDRKKYDRNYERIFGSEKQVRERRKQFIVEQALARAPITPETIVPSTNHMDVIDEVAKQVARSIAFQAGLMRPAVLNPEKPEDMAKIREAMEMPPRRMLPKFPNRLIEVKSCNRCFPNAKCCQTLSAKAKKRKTAKRKTEK